MSKNIVKTKIKENIKNIKLDDNTIVILKGIPLSAVGINESIDLAKVIENKFLYFGSIFGKRQFVSYEEFLLLYDFILSQYKKIYILKNNIFMEQFPIDEAFTSEVRSGLVNHFLEIEGTEDEDVFIGDIDEYISMYNGIKEYNGYLLGSYCDEVKLQNEKIVIINLFDTVHYEIEEKKGATDFIEISEESDFVDLVKQVFSEKETINVKIGCYQGDTNRLKAHIQLLAYNWQDYIDIYYLKDTDEKKTHQYRNEYTEILEKYWGHKEFRSLDIYDMGELSNGVKKVISVSQQDIISDLVEQVENCADSDEPFRDVFVTAPTGAGKSAMFQIPAIYLAEKYNLLTIVISPLIGLMNDQVKGLEVKNYKFAKTINSDISPIIKQDIIDKVSDGEYHILYLSPETLLSRSDVEQLIGERTIGMIVIDEAHIVTTWGKQFRPDYWYLGDHINKLRKNQMKKTGRSFVVATFTATAIYHGVEDMYAETINSLHMIDPITYLGYVKRNDIDIIIDDQKTVKGKDEKREYRLEKFEQIEELIRRLKINGKKALIYFPTVALINSCYEYLYSRRMTEMVAIYHGSLDKDKKAENYEKFCAKEKPVMLATKAFGMGIDIDDIEIVYHFAPTGNVCDYVQEIGRAARRIDLKGEAIYNYDSRDFIHINRLHGLSTIKRYQVVEVVKKIYDLYLNNLRKHGQGNFTKKRNAMLLDAENFTYIFDGPMSDADDSINKVKTALLIIQKDFENKMGFSPITVRPIPLFAFGFFSIDISTQKALLNKYRNCLQEIDPQKHVCRVNLSQIWESGYNNSSFPKFKYLVYSKDEELSFNKLYKMEPALSVSIAYADDFQSIFDTVWNTFRAFVGKKVVTSEYVSIEMLAQNLRNSCPGISIYKARTICEVLIASIDSYKRNFYKGTTKLIKPMTLKDGTIKYQFNSAINTYFNWVESRFSKIKSETNDEGKLYLVNGIDATTKEFGVVLGILEAIGVLSFEMIGGANSQIYIYINQTQALRNIINSPNSYNNKLLDVVNERHQISVAMLTYIYEGNFSSREIWDLLEDYFLGKIPEKVKRECLKKNPNMIFD